MAHDIGYSGPTDEYQPPTGEGNQLDPPSTIQSNPIPTYANIDYLNQQLAALVVSCTNLITAMQGVLQDLSLVVTTDPTDVNLQNAHEVLWPTALGPAPNYITFLYYSSLANVNSAAANFVRNAYETAARGITGSNAIDLLPITQMTLDEANLIQDFADVHAGDLSDSSQRRSVELLQDWVESALQQVDNIQAQFGAGGTVLDPTDVANLSQESASATQAVMQVNLNQLNGLLAKSLGVLQKYFATYQTTFFNNVLGPAMGFRNNVITGMYPDTLPGTVGSVVSVSTGLLDTNLQNVLADQLRRNTIYTTQVQNVLTNVDSRDSYRNFIIQLSASGQTIPSGSPGTMITSTDTPDQAAFFQAATAPDATPSNPYTAPHSQLSGLSDPLAHAQYLLKTGDELEGDLDLDTGVLIDGMRPGTHTHTGQDGTPQIHGSDILTGSVTSTVVNTDDQPVVPTNITLVAQNVDVTSGTASVDISLSWDGDPNLLYEVQIAKAI